MAKLYAKNTWQDEVLSGNERYDVKENDGTAFKSNMQIALSTPVVQAGTAADAAKMNNLENGLDAVDTLLNTVNTKQIDLLTGWIASSGWTYASATTFRIAGDQTGIFQPGIKIKLTQTTVKYFYVVSASYASPNTTVTITGGSDYSLANAAITSPFYSRMANPAEFPQWFNYASTVSGFSGSAGTFAETVYISKFSINGQAITIIIKKQITNWGSWSGNLQVAKPFVNTTSFDFFEIGGGIFPTNTVSLRGVLHVYGNVFSFEKPAVSGFLQISDCAVNDWINISTTYPIT